MRPKIDNSQTNSVLYIVGHIVKYVGASISLMCFASWTQTVGNLNFRGITQSNANVGIRSTQIWRNGRFYLRSTCLIGLHTKWRQFRKWSWLVLKLLRRSPCCKNANMLMHAGSENCSPLTPLHCLHGPWAIKCKRWTECQIQRGSGATMTSASRHSADTPRNLIFWGGNPSSGIVHIRSYSTLL